MKAFKSRLRHVVKEKLGRITHEEMAAKTGLRRTSITTWMGDRAFRRLDMQILEPLAKLLDCKVEELYEVVDVEEDIEVELIRVITAVAATPARV